MELETFLNIIKESDVEGLENVTIEGDLEIEVDQQQVNVSAILPYLAIIQEMRNFLYHANMALSFVSRFSLTNVEVKDKK